MFLTRNYVSFLYECGFLKGRNNFLYKELENYLLELDEEHLSYIKNQEEAIIEKILNK